MLELRNVTKSYRGPNGPVRALDGVSLSIAPGEFAAIRGPSGCGKTTLLLAAGALLAGDEGQVLLAGQDPYAMTPDRRAALRAEAVGFVFQQFHLVPYLSVLDNVLAASLARPACRGDAVASPAADARRRAEELIERFGLAGRARHKPSELSTGERQRTALARALLNRPRLLLADEPTGNLDSDSARVVLEALAAFARDGGAVLLVTHDDRAASYAARTLHMAAGKLRPA